MTEVAVVTNDLCHRKTLPEILLVTARGLYQLRMIDRLFGVNLGTEGAVVATKARPATRLPPLLDRFESGSTDPMPLSLSAI